MPHWSEPPTRLWIGLSDGVKLMKLLLMPNLDKARIHECIRLLSDFSAKHRICLMMNEKHKADFPDCDILYGEFFSLLAQADFCVAVGGDGTIIHMAKHAAIADKPVLGINLGRLGFLATMEMDQLDLLKKLISGDYAAEERMMLKITLQHENGSESWLALNDAVVSKGSLSRMIEFSVFNRDKPVGAYRADGMIASTPTGSTAYSLSAGGPIIDPGISCISLIPISPHSLFSRSMMFQADSKLCLMPSGAEEQQIYLTVDGEQSVPIRRTDKLIIEKSELPVKLINLTGKAFYEVINEKLLCRAHT